MESTDGAKALELSWYGLDGVLRKPPRGQTVGSSLQDHDHWLAAGEDKKITIEWTSLS